jgi:hypothetical protein
LVRRTTAISGDGIAQIVDPYYEPLPAESYKRLPVVGQLCWIPTPQLETTPFIFDIERADPTEHFATKFSLRQMVPSDFRSKNRLPLKLLNLRNTEELIAQRAKRRLAIIVTADYTIFDDVNRVLRQAGKKHLQERSILVAPLFGIQGPNHPGGPPPVMMARVKALMYRQFFYCPPQASPLVYEALVRLDRIQAVIPSFPNYEPMQLSLSKEALGVLMGIIRDLFGATADENIVALKQILEEALPSEARPAAISS